MTEIIRRQFFEDKQANLIFKYENFEEVPIIKFDNAEFHFLLRFYFMLSIFHPVDENERIIYFKGALDEPITCECGNLLQENMFLVGNFAATPTVKPSIHEYYLRIR